MHRLLTLFALIMLSFSLVACSSDGDGEVAEVDLANKEPPVEQLYNEAYTALEKGNFKTASDTFDEVERLYPYSEWATRAKLMSAYSHYKALRYDEAILALDRFIELHPGHPDIAYAFYLKGLSYYEQITDVGRDQQTTRQAMQSLEEVVRRFPDSQYARDAQLKIDLTRDHLAGKEMEIGRFYLKRRMYNAAINRFRTVVKGYETTTHVPEALHRMVESYLALGLTGEAQRIASVLGYNYPGSQWYQDSYELLGGDMGEAMETRPSNEAGWLTRLWDDVF